MDPKKTTNNDFDYLKSLDKHLTVEGSKLTFVIQDGPRKTVGVNGCQVDVLGEALYRIIEAFDKSVPCTENKAAMANIKAALGWLDKRTKHRTTAGIEGTMIQ